MLLPAMLAVTFVYFGFVVAITHRLKARHSEAWRDMGQYTLFVNSSPGGGFKFLRFFVFSNRYLALSDIPLNRLVLVLRGLFAAWAVLFLAEGVAVFVSP